MSAPERIYLQYYGDQEPHDGEVHDVTWSREDVFEHDIEYVLASELAIMRRALDLGVWHDPSPLSTPERWIKAAREEFEQREASQ
jgi:hypothetical protein